MSNYDDYQLEELENSAVKKSKLAKRAAVSAALLGTGAASAMAAEQFSHGSTENANPDALTEDDLQSGAEMGAVDSEVLDNQSQPEPANTSTQTQEIHVYHHYDNPPQVDPEPQPEPQPDPQPEPQSENSDEIEFESTTLLYDNDGNLVAQVDKGNIGDSDFAVLDLDADGKGDYLLYDENHDGEYQENEVSKLEGDFDYTMGQGKEVHHVNIETGKEIYPPQVEHVDINKEDGIDDITNDFAEEKAGEDYSEDLAENTPDYQNDGDVDQYTSEDTSTYDIV
jgi:hypothetical protein